VTTPAPEETEPQQEERRQERLRVLDLSAVGLAFPIALLLGYFAGRTVGGWLGSAQTGAMVGALLGIVGGFYNLFKMVSRLAPRRRASSPTPEDEGRGAP
jgi:F0F1-type ATP synthase assembly protein I